MRFINVLSYNCAEYLTKQLNDNHEKKRVYYYGFQIVIGGIVKFVLLVLITLLLGVFLPTFTVLIFFGALRVPAGGYHMDNYTKCMVTSFGIFILLGFLVKFTYQFCSFGLLAFLSAVVFAVTLITVIKWAPADTPFKPITKPKQIKRLKILSIIMVFIWMVIDIILIYYRMNFYVLAGCLGMLMAAFIVSPAGYRFFDFISGKGRKPKKGAVGH
jgi:accessory gene regulator B